MKRRQFLTRSAGMLALGQGIAGCGQSPTSSEILFLKNSIPPQLINSFRAFLPAGKDLNFKPEGQLKGLFELLENWQKVESESQGFWHKLPFINSASPTIPGLTTTGDAWLQDAIKNQLIQPLKLETLANWKKLDPLWHRLVTRNAQGFLADQEDQTNKTDKAKIWGAPYRWGTTMMVYQRDFFEKLGWTPQDWSDLWRSELTQEIALVDQPREVIGLTLKKLGKSYNSLDLDAIPELKSNLESLQKQVKFYSSTHYLQALLAKDVAIAVGWSNEIVPLLANNPKLGAVIPASGTSLWADLWVMPKGEQKNQDLIAEWFNFCWQPESANQIALFSDGSSPRFPTLKPSEIVPEVRRNPLLLIPEQLAKRCEFLEPLPEASQKQYLSFWQNMRTQGSREKG
ncbi:MAG: extracellular solute-binding protein [Microcystaceae cyanobacterium]